MAALAAAALVTLAAIVLVLAASADDFDSSLGDRLRLGTALLPSSVPVLLGVALLARGDDEAPSAIGRLDAFASVVVGVVATLLLLLRLLADLFADRAPAGGGAGRVSTFLVDLAALVLTAALTWWALLLRGRQTGSRGRGAPAVARGRTSYGPAGGQTPVQQWGQPPPGGGPS